MGKKSCFIVGQDRLVAQMFKYRGWNIVDNENEAEAIIFTGGADINPVLYGERILKCTNINLRRDLEEVKLFKKLPSKLPKIGICRGAQLLNVLSGGLLYQDVDNHAIRGLHDMKDFISGSKIQVTSTHHQMMIPSDSAFLIGFAREATIKIREDEHTSVHDRDAWEDPEALYYEATNSFCFQPHPEYAPRADHDCQEYFFQQIDLYQFG
jgi:gamma-glutamyl-gamma-aminobutyrate hydrolase PuuD